ncbi:methyltransferase domain-containing protein [Hankyongella ginsenosidimutans]|uniref:methyltransferase domain-containing protein n=1 Tax=Hankyongella ginsenosidimutans TaxID=1763828 RepID=UPI001CA3754B|nr:methyltransferase domain-containing protein [Hankyongella ginsenosidimutans]
MVLEKGDAVAHVDVGGQVSWLMGLAASAQVTTVDIRPFAQDVPSLTVKSGSLMALPYDDQSLRSLSCLHVVEHVGLGRYGDPLNPDGCWQAMRELARVVAPAGRLILPFRAGSHGSSSTRTGCSLHRT